MIVTEPTLTHVIAGRCGAHGRALCGRARVSRLLGFGEGKESLAELFEIADWLLLPGA